MDTEKKLQRPRKELRHQYQTKRNVVNAWAEYLEKPFVTLNDVRHCRQNVITIVCLGPFDGKKSLNKSQVQEELGKLELPPHLKACEPKKILAPVLNSKDKTHHWIAGKPICPTKNLFQLYAETRTETSRPAHISTESTVSSAPTPVVKTPVDLIDSPKAPCRVLSIEEYKARFNVSQSSGLTSLITTTKGNPADTTVTGPLKSSSGNEAELVAPLSFIPLSGNEKPPTLAQDQAFQAILKRLQNTAETYFENKNKNKD